MTSEIWETDFVKGTFKSTKKFANGSIRVEYRICLSVPIVVETMKPGLVEKTWSLDGKSWGERITKTEATNIRERWYDDFYERQDLINSTIQRVLGSVTEEHYPDCTKVKKTKMENGSETRVKKKD